MEQRGRNDNLVPWHEAHSIGDEDAVVKDGAVREHRCFWCRRRTGRELDVDRVVRVKTLVWSDCAIRTIQQRAVRRERPTLFKLKPHILVRHTIIHHDNALQTRHALALNLGRPQIACNTRQEVLVAAAQARLVREVGDRTDDEDLDGEVLQRGLDLRGVEGRVQGHEDGAELEARVCEGGELGRVALRYGDAVALFDAEAREGRGEPVGEEVEHVVREGCFEGRRGRGARDYGGEVAVLGDGLRKVLGDGACVEGRLGVLAFLVMIIWC